MTLRQLYANSTRTLDPVDVKTIIMQVLDIDGTRFVLDMDKELSPEELERLENCMERRTAGEPVAYITGRRGFYESTFKVSNATLIPRADTEILVEDAVMELQSRFGPKDGIRILDLCCGTGCIGISVAKALSDRVKTIHLTLADLSEDALVVCSENTKTIIQEENITVKVTKSDLFQDIEEESFDVILSNPPYIRSDVIPTLERQVRFEPLMALDGGEDGLVLVRKIAGQARKHLSSGGLLEMEIGFDQGNAAAEILRAEGYREISVIQDLENLDRVVKAFN